MRTRCQYHCAACDGHFTSLEAFDAHRAGDHQGGRYCLDPMDDARFALKSEAATCDHRGERSGVRLWWLAKTAETFNPASPSAFPGVSRAAPSPPEGLRGTGERHTP